MQPQTMTDHVFEGAKVLGANAVALGVVSADVLSQWLTNALLAATLFYTLLKIIQMAREFFKKDKDK